MKNNKNIYIIILIIAILLIACLIYGYYQKSTFELKNPIATMEIEDYGIVKIELYPEMAPNTVRNFIELINSGYYNGLTFHRVEDSLIQGGDKEGTGAGKTDYTIPGEFELNGFKENTLKFTRGTLGLARADYTMYYYYTGDSSYLKMGYNSGCSQFFIMAKDEENFDGNYCAFGKVIEGLDIIDEITKIEKTVEVDEETGESEETSTPVNPPIIKSITVDTFGINYKAPTKLVVED